MWRAATAGASITTCQRSLTGQQCVASCTAAAAPASPIHAGVVKGFKENWLGPRLAGNLQTWERITTQSPGSRQRSADAHISLGLASGACRTLGMLRKWLDEPLMTLSLVSP